MRDERTYKIIGAAMEVHKQLGPGLVEWVYQEALAIEFQDRGIEYKREAEIRIKYKGRVLDKYYRVDFICYMPEPILVELKAMSDLTNIERAITLNYLYLSEEETALLFNFGRPSLQYERFGNDPKKKR